MPLSFKLPSVASSKDPASYPMFRGQITRGLWRIYTQRLTPAGRWLLLVSAILVGYGGSSLQIQAYVLASYLVAAWALAMLAAVLLRPKLDVQIHLPKRVERGGVLAAILELHQRRRIHGGDLSAVAFNLPASIDALQPDGVSLPDLSRGVQCRAELQLRFKRRGLHKVSGYRITSSFPFGILRSRQTLRRGSDILVYPSFTPLQRLDLPIASGHESSADLVASRLGESFEFLGNREYRQGDNPRDIDWRATARMPEPIVREWIEERQTRATVILDTFLPRSAGLARLEDFESAISLVASITDFFSRNGITLGQLVVGGTVELESVGRHSPDQREVLDLLALVEPSKSLIELPSAVFTAAERGDVIILVLLDGDELRQSWVRQLSAMTLSVKALLVNSEPNAARSIAANIRHVTSADLENGLPNL